MAFHLEKPNRFIFTPGQALDVTLTHTGEPDPEGNSRTLSIASPPYADEIVVATRVRDTPFKRFLKNAQIGSSIKISDPSGSFTLHHNTTKPAVFLAGGIGVTPFVSILLQATRDKLPHELYLFYSNRRPEDAAFLDDLLKAESQNPKFRMIPTMTQMAKSNREWKGETGPINKEILSRYVSRLQGPIYYVAGPPGLVTAMRRMLATAGVDEDDIRTEEFSGY